MDAAPDSDNVLHCENIVQDQSGHVSEISDITAETTSENISPFFRLPGEIRNLIYKYPCIFTCRDRLPDNGVIGSLRKWQNSLGFDYERQPRLDFEQQPAITRVNRQLRRETLGLYYSQWKFHVEFQAPDPRFLYFMSKTPLSFIRWPLIDKLRRGELEFTYIMSKILRHLTPGPGATIQPSYQPFLSHLCISIHTEGGFFLVQRLEFTMSTTAIANPQRRASDCWGPVKTHGLNWSDKEEVMTACGEALTSCPGWANRRVDPFLEIHYGRYALTEHGFEHPPETAGKLACVLSVIARHCPRLTKH
ncbi:hypothetical protein DHEL01_v203263 [Diaporthe helianthi]|uniref:Uncharacterized protein n=1 Tax=Diaporthe helianthi TaxID=158607 RepID=A0A2P5I758_DIAHE|nr:hypothetical protein DHEL01_v203263 [Diaporthe helianthi]